MKKSLLVVIVSSFFVFMLVFGCTKTNPPGPAPTVTNTATNTAVPTSTPVASPNISGTLTFPFDSSGKQYKVVVDSDTNTANGNVAELVGTVNSATMGYNFLVLSGTYYVYAFVDMNNSGLNGPGGLDYIGEYNSWGTVTTPAAVINISVTTQLNITVTLNVTSPADAAGAEAFFGLFTDKTYEALMTPVAGSINPAPSGTAYTVSFEVDPADTGTYYLLGFVNAVPDCTGPGCFPAIGDYIKVYGGSTLQWPSSQNVAVNGDLTLNLALETAVANVTGTMTLPGSANSNYYTIFITTQRMAPGLPDPDFMLTQTAQAGTGSTISYGIFAPVPGPHYIMGIVDMDGSGWNGPPSIGDFAGLYGVTPPILNFSNCFPQTPNATLPGSNFNFTCETMPDITTTPPTPTPLPTPSTAGGTGTISGSVTIPAGQSGKTLSVWVDMDLNPSNNNSVGSYSTTLGAGASQAYSITLLPVGTYYVYAATAASPGPPLIGDAVGVYGATYPSFPGSANAGVTNGGTLTANITAVVATANISGRVYMPAAASLGSTWAVVIDTDTDGGNGGQLGMSIGAISSSLTYFDYTLLVPLPGDYYIYAVVDSADPRDLFSNGPGCGDYMGFYNYPNPVYFTPGGNNTGKNINTAPLDDGCP